MNNDAYYRVSDFLEAEHFFEDLHRRTYEVATSLIKAGKVATPTTMKTFMGDQDLGGVTVSQYLAASPPRPRPSSTRRIMAARSYDSRSAGT